MVRTNFNIPADKSIDLVVSHDQKIVREIDRQIETSQTLQNELTEKIIQNFQMLAEFFRILKDEIAEKIIKNL